MAMPEVTLGRFVRALCHRMCFESAMLLYLGEDLQKWQALFYVLYRADMPGKPACISGLEFTPEPTPYSHDVRDAILAIKNDAWHVQPLYDGFYAPTVEAWASWVASNMLVEGHARDYLDLALTLAKELFPTQPKPLY